MMKPAGLLACVLCLGGLYGASALAATQVYKWVDSDGTVHYSEEPPPTDAKTSSVMIVHSGIAEDEATADTATSGPAAAADGKPSATAASDKQNDLDAKIAEQNKALCPQWQQDIQTLNAIGHIRTADENGDVHFMTEDEKNARIQVDQNQISQYCN